MADLDEGKETIAGGITRLKEGRSVQTRTHSGRSPIEGLRNALPTMCSIAVELESIDESDVKDMPPDEAETWHAELTEAQRGIKALRKLIKERCK